MRGKPNNRTRRRTFRAETSKSIRIRTCQTRWERVSPTRYNRIELHKTSVEVSYSLVGSRNARALMRDSSFNPVTGCSR